MYSPDSTIDAWRLDPHEAYVEFKEGNVREYMRQLRVPTIFVGAFGDVLLAAFDNHPTHWIMFKAWRDQEWLDQRLCSVIPVDRASDLLFMALPKVVIDREDMFDRMSECAGWSNPGHSVNAPFEFLHLKIPVGLSTRKTRVNGTYDKASAEYWEIYNAMTDTMLRRMGELERWREAAYLEMTGSPKRAKGVGRRRNTKAKSAGGSV